ncbi:hypothetical protein H4R24_001378 [Coemansia sp. RSA 988]|nr:hypothetical protein H4R24_001378 [Coemansia sp. RSA 988]
MMTDLDLDSKAILSDLVYFDKHNCLPPDASSMLLGQKQQQQPKSARFGDQRQATATAVPTDNVAQQSPSGGRFSESMSGALQSPTTANGPTKGGVKKHGAVEPHAIATLKVETSAVLKELARFRSCDDQTMSCFYCREWAQWVYRKQISLQTPASGTAILGAAGGASGGAGGGKKKKRAQGNSGSGPSGAGVGNSALSGAEAAERERMERRRGARASFNTVGDLCRNLQGMVAEERESLLQSTGDGTAPVSRPASPTASTSSVTSSTVADQSSRAAQRGASGSVGNAKDGDGSVLIDGIVEQVTLWFEGYQFPVSDVYEDLAFDFPAGAFPYEDNQDPLDPALLLPALQVTKTFISLPAPSFPLLGNITSELIATHTYPTCQHTKADHPTPSELETQRLILNSQLQKWRGEYKRSFEREMEPVWQITQLLLKSAQRIETMRVRLFARGCRANREQFLQTIRNRTQPFVEYWAQVSEPYRNGKAASGDGAESQANGAARGQGKRNAGPGKAKTEAQLAAEVDALMTAHLDNLREVSASWSRTFLESYYGVAREFARELETILGECITMCDRRAQGLKYPPPLTLQPQLARARAAISRLQPQLDARIERIQRVVEERNAEIFAATTELRCVWSESSGATVQTKLARAAHKDFRKRLRRIEYQQQTGVIGWAMRELEHLLTAPDVAAVVVDCLELLMTEAEILERAVGQVFVRKLEPTTDDLCEQRQDIVDDFTEGLLTGREELAGIVGKLMLKEAWRILEANISLQRQRQLLDNGGGGSGGSKSKKPRATHAHAASGNSTSAANALHAAIEGGAESLSAPVSPAVAKSISQPVTAQTQPDAGDYESDLLHDDGDAGAGKKRRRNKKNKKKKGKKGAKQSQPPGPEPGTVAPGPEEDEDDDHEHVGDSQNPFASLTWVDGADAGNERDVQTLDHAEVHPAPQLQSQQTQAQQQAASVSEQPPRPPSQEAPVSELTQQPKAAATGDDSVAAKARSRRGTNAARYVPGVGFVSDDGVSATSPQLISSSASFKPSLGVQTSTARSVTNGRMSPMSAARLASPASRPHSPLVTAATIAGGGSGASCERRPASSLSSSTAPQSLDKDYLAQLHTIFTTGSQEAMERAVAGLTHENLASFALSALNDRRMLIGFVEKMQSSVDRMLDNYDQISSKLESFNMSFDSQANDSVRLTALLAQTAQEAEAWHDKYNRLVEQQASLKSGGAPESGPSADPAGSVPLVPKNAAVASSVAAAAGVWAPTEGPQQSQPLPIPRDLLGWINPGQQQLPMGYASAAGVQYGAAAGFGQFAGMMPHVSGAIPTSFLGNPSFAAAAAHGTLDPTSLMMLAGSQTSQQQGMGGLSLGMPSNAHAAITAAESARSGHSLLEDVAGPLSASSRSSLSAPASASLLTALNAGSQPF